MSTLYRGYRAGHGLRVERWDDAQLRWLPLALYCPDDEGQLQQLADDPDYPGSAVVSYSLLVAVTGCHQTALQNYRYLMVELTPRLAGERWEITDDAIWASIHTIIL